MAVDILNFEQLGSLERSLMIPSDDKEIGAFLGLTQVSSRTGNGLNIVGLRDYQPGDDARHISWNKSASRSDGGLYWKQHEAVNTPLTVFISDLPSHRLSNTPGEMSSRALGFIASHVLLRLAAREGSPILPFWMGDMAGSVNEPGNKELTGARAPRQAIERGLATAAMCTNLALTPKAKPKGHFKRRTQEIAEQEVPPTLASMIERASSRSRSLASLARFIIVSDFRVDFERTTEALRKLGSSQVLTVEVTNPLHRGLIEGVNVYDIPGQRSIVLESAAQRERYASLIAEEQQQVTEGLVRHSSFTTTVDTANVESLRHLFRRQPVKH